MGELKVVQGFEYEVDKIYRTKNYELFSYLEYNREVNEKHVLELIKRIEKYGNLMFQDPVLCADFTNQFKLPVINGQHRVEAAKRISEDVCFKIIPNYTPEMVKSLSYNRGRNIYDELRFYVAMDNINYIKLKDLMDFSKINITALLVILGANKMGFKEGAFEYPSNDKKVFEFIKALEDLKAFKCYKHTQFISAFLDVYFTSGYKHKILLNKLQIIPDYIKFQKSDYHGYIIQFNNIYNYKTQENNRIMFIGLRPTQVRNMKKFLS